MLVLLCTYNEREPLPGLITQIHASVPTADILVVDDQSPDGTGDWVREMQLKDPLLHLLSRPGKLGLGTALLAGIQWASSRPYDVVINLDADQSHHPADIPRLVQAMWQSPGHDLAVASRYVPGGGILGWPWHRRFISRWLNRIARGLLRLPVKDCSGSFRCYRLSTLARCDLSQLRARGYALLEELLYLLHCQGASMVEVPIQFTDRQLGKSKLTLGEAYWTAFTLLRLRWRGR